MVTTDLTSIKKALADAKARHELAFVFGNGINRYMSSAAISWNAMIESLYEKHYHGEFEKPEFQNGMTLTERYDILSIDSTNDDDVRKDIRNTYFGENSGFRQRNSYHDRLQKKLMGHDVPVLTTNYDDNIELGLKKHIIKNHFLHKKGYSEIYRLSEYFAPNEINNDYANHFAVWHIHGRYDESKSIRLGFADYMNLLVQVKKHLHEQACLFNVKKSNDEWGIRKYNPIEKEETYRFTWLYIFYNKSICINGLGLGQDETFLRWLLMSRKKYLNRIGHKNITGWYICGPNEITPDKRFFLNSVGLDVVVIKNLKERYEDLYDF